MKLNPLTKSLFIVVLLGILCSCANGSFVGMVWLPTKLYDGDERPDAQVSTIYSAINTTSAARVDPGMSKWRNGKEYIVQLIGVDGKECDVSIAQRRPADGPNPNCGKIAKVEPGNHKLLIVLRTPYAVDVYPTIRWLESKRIEVSNQHPLRAGYVYRLVPDFSNPNAPSAELVEACSAENHIKAGKNLFMYGRCHAPSTARES